MAKRPKSSGGNLGGTGVMQQIQQIAPNGEPTVLRAEIDLDAVEAFRAYRRSVGLLPGSDTGGGAHA